MIFRDVSNSDEIPRTFMTTKRSFTSITLYQQSPIHRLPNEILSYVFLNVANCARGSRDAILMPSVVSHVCSRWRQIALSTASLWKNIALTLPASYHQLWRVANWLERSHRAPLDIILDFRDPDWDWEEESHAFDRGDMINIVRVLRLHADRWHRLELLTDTWAPIHAFLCELRRVDSVPCLQSLSLSRCNAYFASKGQSFTPAELITAIPLFDGKPIDSLRELTLAGVHVDWSQFPLRHLTKLELKYHAFEVMPSLDEFLSILCGCPDLEHLAILGWGPQLDIPSDRGTSSSQNESSSSDSTRVVELAAVKYFALGLIDVDYALELLSLTKMPVLEELRLEDISATLDPLGNHLDATPVLVHFISGSKAPVDTPHNLIQLRSLSLEGIRSDERTFSLFFFQVGNLRRLFLRNMENAVLHALCPPCHDETISPDLQKRDPPCLELEELVCRNVDPDALAEVMQSELRRRSHPDLRASLDLRACSKPEKINRLKLMQAGVTILNPDDDD